MSIATRVVRTRRCRQRQAPFRPLFIERLEDRRLLAGRAADAVNAFAFDVYEHMQRQEGNLFFSPLSVATALTMAYAGAAGQTAAEMEQVLHLGSAPGIHDSFAALLSSLNSHTSPSGPDIVVANAVWPAAGTPIHPEFLATMEEDYEGHVQALNYSNPAAAEDVINAWVEAMTDSRIKNLVSNLSPATAMVLTNSVYFKALWQFPFDRQLTSSRAFTLDDGSSITVPTMVTQLVAPSTTIQGFNVLEAPFQPGFYDADLSMVFVLPPAATGGGLTSEVYSQIDAWLDGPQVNDYVELTLPKFKTEVSNNLNDVLQQLGMSTAFTLGAANFSAMTPAEVAIDKVFHKTFLELNEEGTEAAAATEVSFVICFAKGTPVLTPDGEKPIDQLQPGDLVLARDEGNLEGELRPKRVEAVHTNEAQIFEIHVGEQVIRTTAQHPFFVRKRGWTPADQVRPGDSLSTNSAGWIAVDDVRPTSATETVYNLRVADYRTFFVGAEKWGFAIWVHNACIPEMTLNRPFHLLIRDNTTSTTLFMGRIDNPLQLQNTVTPTVVEPNADFDGNLIVDGADFLAWQRGLGRTAGATSVDGDSDGDGDVDKNDLVQWAGGYGQVYAPINLPAIVSYSPHSEATSPHRLSADLLDAALLMNWTTNDLPPGHAQVEDEFLRPNGDDYARAFADPGFSPTPAPRGSTRRMPWSKVEEMALPGPDAAAGSLAHTSAMHGNPGFGQIL
jgi:serine protease inhibitor